MTTRIKAWKSTETGQDVPVDSPDTISVAGVLQSGAEVSVHVAAIPFQPSGTRLEIDGRAGTVIAAPRTCQAFSPPFHPVVSECVQLEHVLPITTG